MLENKDLVKVYKNHIHFLPVIPSKKRTKNYKALIDFKWGNIVKYEVTTIIDNDKNTNDSIAESLNSFDLIVFLAVLKACYLGLKAKDDDIEIDLDGGSQSMKYRLIRLDESGNPVIKNGILETYDKIVSRNMYRILIYPEKLCEYALGSGKTIFRAQKYNIYRSLKRIESVTWTWHIRNPETGKIRIVPSKLITEVYWGKGSDQFQIFINSKYLETLSQKQNSITISMKYMRDCKSDIGKLLIYWLQGQKINQKNGYQGFYETTLMNALLLSFEQGYEVRFARRKLQKAFREAEKTGYLEWLNDPNKTENRQHQKEMMNDLRDGLYKFKRKPLRELLR